MRILIITEYFPDSENAEITGGVESRAFHIVRELSEDNEVSVITSWRRGLKREDKIFGATVYRVGIHHPYSDRGNILSRLIFVKKAIDKGISLGNFDIVDGYNFLSYIPAAKIAKKSNIPCVATYHEVWVGKWVKTKGITGVFGSIWERYALKQKWNKIIAVSEQTKKDLINFGIDPSKINVAYNGIDINKFEKIKSSKTQIFRLICVSRLTKDKRVIDLIEAVNILVNKKKLRVNCVIIGKGPEEKQINDKIKKYNLENNIKMLGYMKKHEDVIKEYKKSHLLVFPSILEGFGMVLIEGMASGIPYVCSDISVFKEITNNGKGGLFFKAKNYEDLAKKIEEMMKNRELYSEKQKEAIALVKKYDWKNIIREILRIYKSVVRK